MRMTASWFRSLDLPHTRLWRDSTAPESGLPSDGHPDCIIVLEAVRMRPGEIEPKTRRWKKCVTLLDSKSPLGAESEEKREPASDIDTGVVDSLKVLDPDRPIREADIDLIKIPQCSGLLSADSGTPETLARCMRWRGIVPMPRTDLPRISRTRAQRLGEYDPIPTDSATESLSTIPVRLSWKCIRFGISSGWHRN